MRLYSFVIMKEDIILQLIILLKNMYNILIFSIQKGRGINNKI